jgi:hypothetical protein
MALPSMEVPLRLLMAASASDWVGISTKPNPPRLTRSLIGDEIDPGDLSETDEQVHEFVLGDRKWQIAYIDIHDVLVCIPDRASM